MHTFNSSVLQKALYGHEEWVGAPKHKSEEAPTPVAHLCTGFDASLMRRCADISLCCK